MIRILILSATLLLLITGCGTRSISDSVYHADSERGYAQQSSPGYKGELSEFNVLGIDLDEKISDADIQNALTGGVRLAVAKGSNLMAIQSGAMIPDEQMVKALEQYYNVVIFTGVPDNKGANHANYSKALRLAAARGGAEKLVVYWGVLETGVENHATKAISWTPFVGGLLPDETQRMRIKLKVAVVDVATGQWDMFMPTPFENTDSSGRYSRVHTDQAQVELLKQKAYQAAVDDIVKRYAR